MDTVESGTSLNCVPLAQAAELRAQYVLTQVRAPGAANSFAARNQYVDGNING